MVDQSKRIDIYQEPIVLRDDLDTDLAHKMYLWASAAIQIYISHKFQMDQETINDLLEHYGVQLFTILESSPPTSTADQLVEELDREGKVKAKLIVAILRAGEVNLFIAMFKKLMDLRQLLLRRILFEPGGEGLAIAYKAVNIKKSNFSTIFALS